MFQFVCTRCGKKCKSAVRSATHMKSHTKRKVVDSPSLLRFVKSSDKENPNSSQSYKESLRKLKYDQNQAQSHSVPEPIQSHCASHSIRKYSPLQHQEAQDILAHRLQISATISPESIMSSSLDKLSSEFCVVEGLSVGSMEEQEAYRKRRI